MKVLLGPFCGEIGWELCYWQAHGRWLKKVLPDYDIIPITFKGRQSFYRDYADYIVFHAGRITNSFGKLNCYNADGFSRYEYFKYVEKLLNKHQAYTAFTVPNHNGRFYIPKDKMIFESFKPQSRDLLEKFIKVEDVRHPAVMVFPRHKGDERDWGEEKWECLVDRLIYEGYFVVIAGIKSFSCLAYYERENSVVNLIKLRADIMHSLDLTIYYMDLCNFAIGSQSFLPILSMHQKVPTLVWGAEEERHAEELNYFSTICKFLYDPDYDSSVDDVWDAFKELERDYYYDRR